MRIIIIGDRVLDYGTDGFDYGFESGHLKKFNLNMAMIYVISYIFILSKLELSYLLIMTSITLPEKYN